MPASAVYVKTYNINNDETIKSERKETTFYLFASTFQFLTGIYAIRKTLSSLGNLFYLNGVLRHLFRLAMTATTAWAGCVEGMAVGAIIGTLVPGIGTAVGIAVGALLGATIGSSLGAFYSKTIAQIVSGLFSRNSINSTNASKYELTNRQEHNLSKKYDLNKVKEMIKAIYVEKSKIGLLGSIPFTHSYIVKHELNELLSDLKNGYIAGPTIINDVTYDPRRPEKTFNGSTQYMMGNGIVYSPNDKPSAPPRELPPPYQAENYPLYPQVTPVDGTSYEMRNFSRP